MLQRIAIVCWWFGTLCILGGISAAANVPEHEATQAPMTHECELKALDALAARRAKGETIDPVLEALQPPPDGCVPKMVREPVTLSERAIAGTFLWLVAMMAWVASFILGGRFWLPPRAQPPRP